MNKQELIERIEGLKNLFGNESKYIEIDAVIELASELDEPQKQVVPQIVADWYEEHKDDFETELFQCIYKMPNIFEMNKLSKFEEWLIDEHTKPFQTLVNMHQFGYEVEEEEKRYLVKIKGLLQERCYLNYNPGGVWLFYNEDDFDGYCAHHTRKELEDAGFGEVFNSPLFEVEEVE